MYFDAGIGSLIIQATVAILAVLGGYFAVVKTKIKNRFTKHKDTENVDVEMAEVIEDTDDEL